MSNDKRLDKVECSLTPKQEVILWMEEAHRYSDVVGYVTSLLGLPDTALPLNRLSFQIDRATREAMKGARKEAVEAGVRRAVRDVSFLFHLHNQVNFHAASHHEAWEWRLIALDEWLGRMRAVDAFFYALQRNQRGDHGSRTRRQRADKDRQDWKLLASALTVELYEFQLAAASISRRYFEGQAVLFADSHDELTKMIKEIEGLMDCFNGEFTSKGKQSLRVDLEDIRRRISKRANLLADALVDFAKCDALMDTGERRAGLELLERHL